MIYMDQSQPNATYNLKTQGCSFKTRTPGLRRQDALDVDEVEVAVVVVVVVPGQHSNAANMSMSQDMAVGLKTQCAFMNTKNLSMALLASPLK